MGPHGVSPAGGGGGMRSSARRWSIAGSGEGAERGAQRPCSRPGRPRCAPPRVDGARPRPVRPRPATGTPPRAAPSREPQQEDRGSRSARAQHLPGPLDQDHPGGARIDVPQHACLLARLARSGIRRRLAGIDAASRKGPSAGAGSDQEHLHAARTVGPPAIADGQGAAWPRIGAGSRRRAYGTAPICARDGFATFVNRARRCDRSRSTSRTISTVRDRSRRCAARALRR